MSSPVNENKRNSLEGPPVSTKKAKPSPKAPDLRAWSAKAGEKASSYTVKCKFGDPSKPLPSHIKNAKVDEIRRLLELRGLPTNGKKSELLTRLQTQVPFVTVEIDTRECLQRLIHMMLYYFGWDNTHLFRCKMPARGQLELGSTKLREEFGIDTSLGIQMGQVSGDPNHPMYRDKRMFRHMQRKLENLGMTWDDLQRACEDEHAQGKWRELQGAGFRPEALGDIDADFAPEGGFIALKDLELQAGDTIDLEYDFGDGNKFTLEVVSLEHNKDVLPETSLDDNPTRAKLLAKTTGTIPPQYRGRY